MQIFDGQLVVSATDLVGHLACEHLTALERGAARGEWKRPVHEDPELDLLQKKGAEHESRCLQRFQEEGKSIVSLASEFPRTVGDLLSADSRTLEAMRSGAHVIYQGTVFDGRWRGHPDFLVRVDRASGLGEWSYEPADAKLARRVRAGALLQLCLYAEQLSRLQGLVPEQIAIVTGEGRLHRHRFADYSAYYRTVKGALETRLFGTAAFALPYPDPVEHCRVCRWFGECADRRRADDHLCRVASITRGQTKRLVAGGIPVLTALATAADEAGVPDMVKRTFDRLRHQARLQREQYGDGRVRYELIPPDPAEPNRGLASLPEPSPGDVFLDIENDPWAADEGREYLLGLVTQDGDLAEYQTLWSHSAAAEKENLERFIDLVMQRRQQHPSMHVYHYGAYEETALKRLVSRYGTREDELDQLLRGDALVDLYAVVRQGIRVSQESYSLKKVEKLYMPDREGPVTRPGFAIVEYERWLESPDPTILESIAAYNRDDCLSIWRLRTWLEDRRGEAEALFHTPLGRPQLKDGASSEEMLRQGEATRALLEALLQGLPAARSDRTIAQQAQWILAHLLDWHRREAKPEWWRYYDLLGKPIEDLVASSEALGDLTYVGPVREIKRSIVHRYWHDPEQEHKFKVGDKAVDPATKKAVDIVGVDETEGTIDLKRGKGSKEPHPRALVPAAPVQTNAQRDALRRVADHVIAHGIEGSGPYRAVRDLLLRRPPRVRGMAEGQGLATAGEDSVDAARRLAIDLDESCLPVQGPPGSGKTFTGARMIVELLKRGKKVGIAATAHKAITNLVDEVCRAARKEGHGVRVIQRCEEDEASGQPEITVAEENDDVVKGLSEGAYDVAAGTPWLFSRGDMEGLLDVLFVDEAGQMSLANVVAMGGVAASVVLLGDPNQLPQVTKGTHPEGAEASALEHVLAELGTIPPERGLFLAKTWRLHPKICSYISEAFYEGRLEPHESTHQQTLAGGARLEGSGIRLLGVSHGQNSSRSEEEAIAVADLVETLVGRPWTNQKGETQPLSLDDILIVAPYNLQVGEISRRLLERLGSRARVGTVDKFQGQEGALAIYSTATSSPDDAPRDVGFLYSRNRLNVAISRARAMGVLVCSPDLFRIRCRTAEEMRMANAFCLLREATLV
jgi:predicted RecB family nuclease